MRTIMTLFFGVAILWGCSRHSRLEVQARLMPGGSIRYEGPLAGPYRTFGAMADAACEQMTQPVTPGEGHRALGYCALYFYSPEDHGFFISHIARLEGESQGLDRFCAIPRDVLKPEQTRAVSLGGTHWLPQGHSPMAAPVWRPTRFLDSETQVAWDQDTLVFSLEESGKCTSYDYGYFQGIVAVQHGDQWLSIGEVYREGNIQAIETQ